MLKELKCRGCNLKKINPQVYNLLQHLSELDIGDNQVIFFLQQFFIFICGNKFFFLLQLKYLEKEEFYDLRRLKKLRIDGNQLSVVIDNLFIQQKNLEYLGNFFVILFCATKPINLHVFFV